VLRSLVALATVGALASAGTAGAAASPYAPLDRPGPRLSVPAAHITPRLLSEGDYRHVRLETVLHPPGTSATAEQNFSWNYERAFNAQHRPWCAVTPPHHTLGDIQVAGEYLV
jgi:hypothetical protein